MHTFTLEEAAALIANKYGLHERAHATLVEQLLEAARAGTLTVRHPHTDLPYRPEQHRAFYETVGVADLNSYFEGAGVQWRLESYGETADPLFDTEWWNLHQVLAWVYLGDRALVKVGAIVNQDAHFQLKLKAAERQGVCYPSVCAAEKAIVEALQTGKLTAYGLRNGGGDLTGIPSAQWADLKFWWDPDHAGPSDCFRPMENCWVTLRFQRKDVLAIWPDRLGQPDHRQSTEKQPGDPAPNGNTTRRTGAANATRETRKAHRLRDLKRFIDDVYGAAKRGDLNLESGNDRKALPFSHSALRTVFLERHPEHEIEQTTFNDDVHKISAKVKPGPKRMGSKYLRTMLAKKDLG